MNFNGTQNEVSKDAPSIFCWSQLCVNLRFPPVDGLRLQVSLHFLLSLLSILLVVISFYSFLFRLVIDRFNFGRLTVNLNATSCSLDW